MTDDVVTNDDLVIWTIYNHPLDYPQGYIARAHLAGRRGSRPTNSVERGTLAELRAKFLAAGLICMPRDESDDAKIVESWM